VTTTSAAVLWMHRTFVIAGWLGWMDLSCCCCCVGAFLYYNLIVLKPDLILLSVVAWSCVSPKKGLEAEIFVFLPSSWNVVVDGHSYPKQA
jgi:hypothetical protein